MLLGERDRPGIFIGIVGEPLGQSPQKFGQILSYLGVVNLLAGQRRGQQVVEHRLVQTDLEGVFSGNLRRRGRRGQLSLGGLLGNDPQRGAGRAEFQQPRKAPGLDERIAKLLLKFLVGLAQHFGHPGVHPLGDHHLGFAGGDVFGLALALGDAFFGDPRGDAAAIDAGHVGFDHGVGHGRQQFDALVGDDQLLGRGEFGVAVGVNRYWAVVTDIFRFGDSLEHDHENGFVPAGHQLQIDGARDHAAADDVGAQDHLIDLDFLRDLVPHANGNQFEIGLNEQVESRMVFTHGGHQLGGLLVFFEPADRQTNRAASRLGRFFAVDFQSGRKLIEHRFVFCL